MVIRLAFENPCNIHETLLNFSTQCKVQYFIETKQKL